MVCQIIFRMMTKIALITEGITDQYIIRPIIENYFVDNDFAFRPISPCIDETDKQIGFGSWTNVIKACQFEDFEEVFKYNDYVVIQIDADISHEKGFDVPHFRNGIRIEYRVLCENIIRKLISEIPLKVFDKYCDRFIFAIGVLTMECWLLTMDNHTGIANSTSNCLFKINKLLARRNEDIIAPDDKNSYRSKQVYKMLSNRFKSKKIIKQFSKRNIGFQIFIEQLENRLKCN